MANTTGVYEFILDNSHSNKDIQVTFAIHSGNNTDISLSVDHLDKLYNQLIRVSSKLDEVRVTEQLVTKKKESHYELSTKHNKNIVMYSIIETAVMIFIFFMQMLYIRNLVK